MVPEENKRKLEKILNSLEDKLEEALDEGSTLLDGKFENKIKNVLKNEVKNTKNEKKLNRVTELLKDCFLQKIRSSEEHAGRYQKGLENFAVKTVPEYKRGVETVQYEEIPEPQYKTFDGVKSFFASLMGPLDSVPLYTKLGKSLGKEEKRKSYT